MYLNLILKLHKMKDLRHRIHRINKIIEYNNNNYFTIKTQYLFPFNVHNFVILLELKS